MLDITMGTDGTDAFASNHDVEYLVAAAGHPGALVLFDGSGSDNKRLESDLARSAPDIVFGCEWVARADHMDYPKHAMRIQSARAIRDASALYALTPRIFSDRSVLAVAMFNARVLKRAKVPIVFLSLARSEAELASPKDLEGIGRVLGFSDEAIAQGRSMLERLRDVRYEKAFSVETPRSSPDKKV